MLFIAALTVEPSRAIFFFAPIPSNDKSDVRFNVSAVFTGEALKSSAAMRVPYRQAEAAT